MLEQILETIKKSAGDLVVNNAGIPNQYNEAVINDVADATVNGFKQAAVKGNIQDIISIFTQNGKGAAAILSNPVVQNIVSGLVGQLATKYGIKKATAQNVIESIIPQLLSHVGGKVNDPADSSIDLESIIGAFTGGKGANIADIAGKILGGDSKKGAGGLLGGLLDGFMK